MTDPTNSSELADSSLPDRTDRRTMLRRSAVVGATAWAAPTVIGMSVASAAASPAPVTTFQVPLSGAQEVPAGDPDGSGSATVTIDGTKICIQMTVTDVSTVTAAHIHNAPAGSNGVVVVNIGTPTTPPGTWDVCIDDGDTATWAAQIEADPTSFYLNVHTTEFPAGTVRGQIA